MAAPMLLMAAEQSTTREPTKPFFGSYGEPKPDPTRPTKATKKSGKGSGSASNSKKQPQRGLGVAQLERLRLQDRLKKMSQPEPPQLQTQPRPRPQILNLPAHQYQHNFQYQNPPVTLPDPLSSIPVHYGVSTYHGPVLISGSGGNASFGFVGQRVGGASGFGYVGGNNLVVKMDPNPYGAGDPDQRFQAGGVYEASKELSSMPKIQSLSSDCCDLCLKKKRFNRGRYMGFSGRSDKSAANLPIKGSDFGGFNTEMGSFGAQVAARTAGYSSHRNPLDQGVEVRAVHRKGSSAAAGSHGGVFMEYDFFPAAGNKNDNNKMRGGGGTCPKEVFVDDMMLQMQTVEASVSMGSSHEEASDITAASYGYGIGADSSYNHHNPVDLSLKLSF